MAQKQSTWNHFGQCSCCLRYANLRNMWEKYSTDGKGREIYGKMLVDCYSISWTIHKQADDDKICQICVLKLREAIDFKNQVLESQQELMQQIKAEKQELIVEVPMDEDTKDFEVEYLDEGILDVIENNNSDKKDYQHNAPMSQREKPKTNDALIYFEDNTDLSNTEHENRDVTSEENVPVVIGLKIERMNDDEENMQPTLEYGTKENAVTLKQTMLNKHGDNIRSILITSNATPIRGYWGTGYCCSFCPSQFKNPEDLKQHTFTHENMPFKLKIKNLAEHVVKLDISYLKCNMCDKDMDTLKNLMTHIRDEHTMPIHFDIPNHIVPFRFESSEFSCVECSVQFDRFKSLYEHMHDVHYRNYNCNVCDRGFVNISSLKTHSIRHRITIFDCAVCTKVFNTKMKMVEHERIHHCNREPKKCRYCDETFLDDVNKSRHEIVSHGQDCEKKSGSRNQKDQFSDESGIVKCPECGLFFRGKDVLQAHMDTHKDLSPCPICSKVFYTEKALKEHIRKHDITRYANRCELCEKKFKSEGNYRFHMKHSHGLV